MNIRHTWFVWFLLFILIVTGCGGRKATKTSHVAPRGMHGYSPRPPPRHGRIEVKIWGFYKDSLLFKSIPSLVDTPKVEYPAIAKQAGVEGTVRLVVSVDSSGAVIKAVVARSSGNMALDEASVGASKFRFSRPLLKKKKKRAPFPSCDLIVHVVFRLEIVK